MATNGTLPDIPPLPNPFTPMAWIPADVAFQLTIANYLFVGSLAVLIWDIINNLGGDYIMTFKQKISPPTAAYIFSRVSTLAFILASTIYYTAPTGGHCNRYERGFCWVFPIAMTSTSVLFFYRLRAVYNKNIYVTVFFAAMVCGVFGATATVPIGITGANIGLSKYCTTGSLATYIPVATIFPLINDTMVFFAIAFKLLQNSQRERFQDGVKSFLFGTYLPRFSRVLLQDGQIYYLTTVTVNIITLILLYAPVGVVYRSMLAIPNLTLMNIMACRVFRKIKVGPQRILARDTDRSTIVFPLTKNSESQRLTEQSVPESQTRCSHCSAVVFSNLHAVAVKKTVATTVDSQREEASQQMNTSEKQRTTARVAEEIV